MHIRIKLWVLLTEFSINKGAKIIFLLRLTPLVPYNIANYLIGATSVKLLDFMIGNIGQIPEWAMVLYIGNAFSKEISLIIGIWFGLIVLVYVGYLAKKEMEKELDEDGTDMSHIELSGNRDYKNENKDEAQGEFKEFI